MITKVLDYIKKYDMISFGDCLTVAFSGGADSVTLLHILKKLAPSLSLKLSAVHINHSLRGEESDRDENFCREFCQKYKIKFYSRKLDVASIAKKEHKSVEQTAREVRYKILSELSCPSSKIATAHSLSDSVETTIFNLTRGTGPRGLTGIPPVRDSIIRPLLSCTRAEIEQYCLANNLNYCTDSTNLQNDYTRNKIRNLVIPVLKEINPNLEHNIEATQSLLLEDDSFLFAIAKKEINNIKTENGYKINFFLLLSLPIARRVIILLLSKFKIEQSINKVDLVYNCIKSKINKTQLSADCFLICKDNCFTITQKEKDVPSDFYEVSFNKEEVINKEIVLPNGKILQFSLLECKEIENIEKNYPEGLKNLLDYDKIDTVLIFRQRKPSDKITLAKRGITKSLKKLFNEDKIAPAERSSLVIIESGGGLAWLEKYGSDSSFSTDSTTTKALYILVK